ncbi:MAG: HD domain-containing protein [Proteobacteria bacterium]|nr:HD domain-containing protein [Pseudomonadota bacterium]
MDIEIVKSIAYEAMGTRQQHPRREPGWLYYHGHRVGNIALSLSDTLDFAVDRNIIYAGALFHDVGKGSEPHNATGADRALTLLEEVCSQSELAGIYDIVWNHNQRHDSGHTHSAKLVQDADILDHVGKIAPWLAFYWSGSRGEAFAEHRRYLTSEENGRYRQGMRAALNFEISKSRFDERIAYEDRFFSEFQQLYQEGEE